MFKKVTANYTCGSCHRKCNGTIKMAMISEVYYLCGMCDREMVNNKHGRLVNVCSPTVREYHSVAIMARKQEAQK